MTQPRRTRTGKIDFKKAHYTVAEVAEHLSFSVQTIRDWERARPQKIRFIDIGGSKRVPVTEVLRLCGKSTDPSDS